ncbi:MAG: hypothetical protein IKF19_00745 [Bacilli bacterium]|nr:hypothetical protein [Bacilli bacterium]
MNNNLLEERIINTKVFKSLFTNNSKALAKLISDITRIPYKKLQNNIVISTNEIPITNKNKKNDFIVMLSSKPLITKNLNTKKYKGLKTKNLSYSINLISDKNNYNNKFLIIQINFNTFSDKSSKYIDVFELRNQKGKKYIDNFKIYTLDIVKCHKIYYNNFNNNNNIIKWGTFLYSKPTDKNIINIIDNILDNKALKEIKLKLDNINEEIVSSKKL